MTGLVRAIFFPDREAFDRLETPGSFHLVPGPQAGLFTLWHFCPCGCGSKGRLFVGEHEKPGGERPSWRWNGSRTEPTLDPSIHHVGHWHGWLRNGYWRVA